MRPFVIQRDAVGYCRVLENGDLGPTHKYVDVLEKLDRIRRQTAGRGIFFPNYLINVREVTSVIEASFVDAQSAIEADQDKFREHWL